jgi:sulfate/thiosulfate transport system substrate-binding protein
VIDGVDANLVTLVLAYDIDAIADKTHLLPSNWQSRLPAACPTKAAPHIGHRAAGAQGQPRGHPRWDDLVRPCISVITPNPKTSGGARFNFLSP